MKTTLEKSQYSHSFQVLKYMGAWVIDSRSSFRISLYSTYKLAMTVLAFGGVYSLFVDLYLVFGNFKKMTWNLCITALFTGALLKNIFTIHANKTINRVRASLHQDAVSRSSPEDEAIHKMALKELKLIWSLFYGAVIIFVPTWLLTRYFSYLWGPKDFPIPLRLPFDIDRDNNFQYHATFFVFSMFGIFGIVFVMHTELSMFTLLIQISREYRILLKDIPTLDEIYLDIDSRRLKRNQNFLQEVNPELRTLKAKMLLKIFSKRQQKLIEYTEGFEMSYSSSLLLQVFIVSVLVTVSAIQCILETGSISMNLSYQIGYTLMLVADLFLVCWFSTRIRGQCFQVGIEVYSTLWYKMAIDNQKDVRMIIMRSQRPPKLTSGKVMELNLHAFMMMMRNIYSWLALFQQLVIKGT